MKKIVFSIMIIALLLISGCKQVEEQPIVEEPIMVEEVSQEEVGAEDEEEGKILKLLKCTNGAIEAEITNYGDAEMILAKDTKILVNGLLIVDPVCDSMTVAPGETIYCEDISGHIATRTGKVNTIVVNSKQGRAVEYVDCAETA